MIRIVGILSGSAIAIAFLILALGIPEFPPKNEAAAEIIVNPDSPPLPPVSPPEETVLSAAELPVEATEIAVDDEPAPQAIVEPIKQAIVEAETITESAVDNWFAFWSPFRSELAANGFVSQLQRSTGLDYRVVRLKPGVYEVAFAYADEADIETKLAAISAATGLERPGG